MKNIEQRALLDINDTYSLRGIAMLLIIISHTYNGYPIDNPTYHFPLWIKDLHLSQLGTMGVGVFFFCSGYGLFSSLNKKQIDKLYIFLKVRRLFAPYIIYWIVEIVVLVIFNKEEITVFLYKEIFSFSIHPDVENWFFKVILIAYIIVFALFYYKIVDTHKIAIIWLLSIAYVLVMKELGFGQWWYNTIFCFPLGAMVAHKYTWFANLPTLFMIIFSCSLIMIAFFSRLNHICLYPALVTFAIYAIRMINIQNKILFFVGSNSLVFYYIECPVMDEIMMFSYSCYPLYCVLSVIGTFVLSYLIVRMMNTSILRTRRR